MNPTLGLLLDASFYLMAWLTFDRPGKGCEGDELGLVWNRSGEHIASQTVSGSRKGYSQQCGIWAPSEGVTTGNEGLYSPVQGNSLFLFKLEMGVKTYLVNSRPLQYKERQEKSRCSTNLVIQLQCAQTR